MRCCDTCACNREGYCVWYSVPIESDALSEWLHRAGNVFCWTSSIIVIPDEEMGEGAR